MCLLKDHICGPVNRVSGQRMRSVLEESPEEEEDAAPVCRQRPETARAVPVRLRALLQILTFCLCAKTS